MEMLNAIVKEGTLIESGLKGFIPYRLFEFRGNKFEIIMRRID